MTTEEPRTDGHDDDGFDWHSRRTMAAGLVLVLVAVAVIWALTSGHGDKNTASKPAAYDSACGLTGGSTATPTTGPQVQWQNVDGAWLPVSTTQGPGRRNPAGAWSCFAHTPTGAVLAGLTISNRMGVASDFAGLIKQQTLPGPGQTIQLKQGQSSHSPNDQVTPFGFVLNAYDPTAATVTLRNRSMSGAMSPVVWAYIKPA